MSHSLGSALDRVEQCPYSILVGEVNLQNGGRGRS